MQDWVPIKTARDVKAVKVRKPYKAVFMILLDLDESPQHGLLDELSGTHA